MEPEKAINIRIEADLHDRVQAAARLNFRSIASEVRMLLAKTYGKGVAHIMRVPHDLETK